MNIDFGLLAVAVVLAVLLIRLLLLSPAAMWAEAEAERRRPSPPPVVGTVEAGGVVTINYYGTISAGETSTNVGTRPASVVTGQDLNEPPGPGVSR